MDARAIGFAVTVIRIGRRAAADFAETMSEVFADPDNQPVRRKENYGK